MFRELKNNEVAVLKSYNKEVLHTFFVFYPIDIICLDNKNRVIEIKKNIKPFNPYIKINKKTISILEFKKGNSKGIKIGQKIKIA